MYMHVSLLHHTRAFVQYWPQSQSVDWTQELYEGFEYKNAKPFFHVFEGDDAVYALSFAEGFDAASFHSAVRCGSRADRRRAARRAAQRCAAPRFR